MDNKYELVFKLLVSLCRVHDLDEKNVIDAIESGNIDWNLFLVCCFKNKVAGLVYSNINKLKMQRLLPSRVLYAIKYFHHCNRMRNEATLLETQKIRNAFSVNNVPALFLKGSILLPEIYKDEGARMLNDIDIYIKKDSRKDINELMLRLGYIQGEFDESKQIVVPISKEDELLWKLKMFNLPPYQKMVIEGLNEAVAVDFSFGLTFSQKSDLSEIMFDDTVTLSNLPTLSPIKLFIQICCHLHKEATNAAWQEIGQDINLIKFCDVRESYYRFICGQEIDDVLETAKLLGVQEAVYYSLKHSGAIYSDEELVRIADMMKPESEFDENNIYSQDNNVVGKRTLSIAETISSI